MKELIVNINKPHHRSGNSVLRFLIPDVARGRAVPSSAWPTGGTSGSGARHAPRGWAGAGKQEQNWLQRRGDVETGRTQCPKRTRTHWNQGDIARGDNTEEDNRKTREKGKHQKKMRKRCLSQRKEVKVLQTQGFGKSSGTWSKEMCRAVGWRGSSQSRMQAPLP